MSTGRILKYIAFVAGPLLLIIGGELVWSRMLRRRVAARTAELRRSTELQRAMVECSPAALYTIDTNGNVLTWNASAERIFGWTEEEVEGKPLPIVPEDNRDEFASLRRGIARGGSFAGRELMRLNKSGSLFPIRLSAAPIFDDKGAVVAIMATAEDITVRTRLESQLRQAEKMEAIGRLAGGVAHDFNNLLMGIMNYTELCRDGIEPGHPVREWLDEITHEAERSANLTRQLLAFARKQTIDPQVLNLNEAV